MISFGDVFRYLKNSKRCVFYYKGKIEDNRIVFCLKESDENSKLVKAVMRKISQEKKVAIVSEREMQRTGFRASFLLSKAKYIVSNCAMADGWTKKENQCYLKLVDTEYVSELSRQKLIWGVGRNAQIDAFQVDYFICENSAVVDELRNIEILRDYCLSKILELTNDEVDIKNINDFSYNKKDNVLIYGSALEQNGLTSSLLNLLDQVNVKEKNYWVCGKFNMEKNAEEIAKISPDVGMKMMTISYTFGEFIAEALYYKFGITWDICKRYLERLYQREYQRNFANMRIDTMIQFTGYEGDVIHLFAMGNAKHIIYVHSDMEREIQVRKAQHKETLKKMYPKYDTVVVVNEKLLEPTKRLGGEQATYKVVNNFFDNETIKEKAEKEIIFGKETLCNWKLDEVISILETDADKFITIGRFSKEKGHTLLLDAFQKYLENNKNTYLFIIGGRGNLYEDTKKYAQQLGILSNVIFIREMQNPMPILKRCDLFILPSLYEGFGLVVLEAAALDVPVFVTNTVGSAEFVETHGGVTVDCSIEGILSGLNLYNQSKLNAMEIDFEEYNRDCMEQFKAII